MSHTVARWFSATRGDAYRGQWDYAPQILDTSLEAAIQGAAYSRQMTANGLGTWALTVAPTWLGLALSSAGVFSGVPASSGVAALVVEFTTLAGRKVSKAFDLLILAGEGDVPIITTSSLPDGQVGVPYDQPIGYSYISGGVVTIDVASLPAGLTTADSGRRIVGTPAAPGTFSPQATPTGDGVHVGAPKRMSLRIVPAAGTSIGASGWAPAIAGITGGKV